MLRTYPGLHLIVAAGCLLIVAVVGGGGSACRVEACHRPLRAYCDPCLSFEDAVSASESGDVVRLGDDVLDYKGDATVWECGGEYAQISVAILGSLAGRFEYYRVDTGELVGVATWTDTPWSCGVGVTQSYSAVYGTVPECEPGCLMDWACNPEDDPECLEYVGSLSDEVCESP
jgi:hypothetical protein